MPSSSARVRIPVLIVVIKRRPAVDKGLHTTDSGLAAENTAFRRQIRFKQMGKASIVQQASTCSGTPFNNAGSSWVSQYYFF